LGIIQRQALLNTIINYAGVAIGFVNVIFLFPLFLSQEEFGLTRLILSLATTIAQLSSFGTSRISVKFFPLFRTKTHKNNGLLVILFTLSTIGFSIFTLLYYALKYPIINHYKGESVLFSEYYVWVPIAALGLLLFLVFESFLQALQKTVFTNFLRTIVLRVYWLVALLFYYFEFYSFFNFMIIYMLGYFFTAGLCIIQLIKHQELSFDINKNYTRKRILKPLVNYGAYTLFSSITLTLVQNIDILMIGAIMPENKLENIGIYAIATYIVTIIYIPKLALMRISAPIIAVDWKKRDLEKISTLHKKSAVILVFLSTLIFGGIFLNVESLLQFLKPEYASARYVIIILGLSRVLDTFFGLNYLILVVTKFYKMESILALFLLALVTITNYFLIPIYGINGAAIGTASVFLSFNIILTYYIWNKLKINSYSFNALKMFFLGILAGLIVYFLPIYIENHYLLILIKSTLFTSLYIIPVYFFKISTDINRIINKLINFTR